MTRFRHVIATATVTVLTALTGIVTATHALAQLPPPDPGSVPAVGAGGSNGASWTLTYLLVGIAVIEAAALVAVTIRLVRTGDFRRHRARMA